MSYRLTKIYTRKGDDGTTSLDTRNRIAKNAARIEAIGDIDELNSVIGMVIAFDQQSKISHALHPIQQTLFDLGGELALPDRIAIHAEKTTELEQWIDEWNAMLPPLKEFILPGGTPASATCHLARTVCRRAERSLVTLQEKEKINSEMLRYINRLSDVLFVAARILAKEAGEKEILWDHEK